MVIHIGTGYGAYGCNYQLYLERDGKAERIAEALDGASQYAAWAPDGKSLTFTNNATGTNEVYRYTLATGAVEQLTQADANDERGELSPDNQWLVFSSDRNESGNQDLLLKNLESGTVSTLFESPGLELIARWSADGKTIFFGSNKDGNWDLYSIDVASRQTTQLTFDEAFDGDPRPQP